jgi:cyclopropane fatty-acyl-phospholipid synthase-like methyltransferase
MPDPYATIADADLSLQQRLSDVLELRASDPQQQAMLRAYLSEIQLPHGAKALEIGCGTGAVSRALAGTLKLDVTGAGASHRGAPARPGRKILRSHLLRQRDRTQAELDDLAHEIGSASFSFMLAGLYS